MTPALFKCGRDVLLVLLVGIGVASAHVRTSPEFDITLPVAYDKVLDVVREVCADGVIHGTFQYDKETGLSGASATDSSKYFPESTGRGEVMYKARSQAIAPAHFVGSNDQGTVAVRYVVESRSANQTRIHIDAVFVEDSRHHRHASEGMVETAEFREIAQKLKILERQAKQQQAEILRREQELQRQKQEADTKRLQSELESERARLASLNGDVEELDKRLQALRHKALARVKSELADVKASPVLHANNLQPVARGQIVQVLQRTPSWVRVHVPGGQEGWIYGLLLEDLP